MFYCILQYKNIYIGMLLYKYGLINKYKILLNIIVIKKLSILKQKTIKLLIAYNINRIID